LTSSHHHARNAGTLCRHRVAFAAWIALAGCATVGSAPTSGGDDPLEPVNRFVFDVNTKLDHAVIEPLARTYRDVIPAFVRDRIRSFVDNLAEPRIFINDMLQGRGDAAATTFGRFFLNMTAGALGFFDAATDAGLRRQSGDFGQTLYAWGIDDGPFLMLLFFGPSNVRDAVGLGVDLVTPSPTASTPIFKRAASGAGSRRTISKGAVNSMSRSTRPSRYTTSSC